MSMWKGARSRILPLMAVVVGLASSLWLAEPAMAGQGASSSAIIGVLTDNTGALVPGVTVTATSPALQVPSVTTVSDERGEYRLTPLPPGLYTVLFELAGFQTVQRTAVRLTVGFTARVDAELLVGGVAETVTVTGASPLVDTTSTTTSTEFTFQELEVLPTTRDGFQAFMSQAPGVRTNIDVGSSGLNDTLNFKVMGEWGQSWQLLEGVMGAAPNAGAANGAHVDFNALEGARVETLGSNAEMPRSGLLIDAVVKSGGNDFHGALVAYGTGPKLESNNIDEELEALGFRHARMNYMRDFSGTLGGRIIRDKLWFFGGVRDQRNSRQILDAFDTDGSPIPNIRKAPYFFGKVSYQMTPGNRFTGFFHGANDQEFRGASRFIPRETMVDKDGPISTSKGDWQTVRGEALVAGVQYGRWHFTSDINGISPGKVATIDEVTRFQTGNLFARGGSRRDMGRHHSKAFVNYFKRDLLAGNHEFKLGVDHLLNWWKDGAVGPEEGAADYRLVFRSGVPFQIETTNIPTKTENYDNFVGVYAQDVWSFTRRVTLNLGLRFDHNTAWAPEQCSEAVRFSATACYAEIRLVSFNAFAPRVHVAFDVRGDGTTVIKGGYGRFNAMREIDPDVTALNANTRKTIRWDWRDLNGNRDYDTGEVNLDPNGPDFRQISEGTRSVINPNEKQPKTDEFSLTFEHEVFANTAVRVTGAYSRNINVYALSEISREGRYTIPVTNLDPGPDGSLGTPDDTGRSFTYYEYPTSVAGAAFAQTMMINLPDVQAFKTFEIAAIKRPSNNWQVAASFTNTWFDVPVTCGPTNEEVRRCPTNPNQAINSANTSSEWAAKLSGAYSFPYGVNVSTSYEARSGLPQARQVLFTGGQTIRSILLNVEPLGTFRLPSLHAWDARVAKRVNLGTARSLELRADIFNLLNKNTVRNGNAAGEVGWVTQSGPSYLRPGVIMFPRVIQLGATFMF